MRPGELIDVGGHRLHVVCRGTGSPPVLLESGIAASSVSWALVQPRLAAVTRACAYDRAGFAWSDPPSRRRTRSEERRVGKEWRYKCFEHNVNEDASLVLQCQVLVPLSTY